MGKQQHTHIFGFSVFPIFDSHPRLSFIRFQFYSFQISNLRFLILIFRLLTLSKLMFQLFICRFVYFRFQNFDVWFLVFGLRRLDTFTNRLSFCVFSIFRFHICSFWYSVSNFLIPDAHSETQEEVPELRFTISIFICLTLSKLLFQLLICRFVYFCFQNDLR